MAVDWEEQNVRASIYIPGLAEKLGQTPAKPWPLRDQRVRRRIGPSNLDDWLFLLADFSSVDDISFIQTGFKLIFLKFKN
jgi:hypothetical protein